MTFFQVLVDKKKRGGKMEENFLNKKHLSSSSW